MTIISLFGIIAAVLLGAVLLAAVIFLFAKLFGMTILVLRNVFRFIGEEITDTLRLVGAVLASVLFAPLVVLSIVIGRWSASKHYAGAFHAELRSAGRCVYRLAIGNIARLFGVSKALEGVEQRVPEMMAAAPTRDKPSKRAGIFEGYTIIGSLKGGGSGGKLYIAEPDEIKQAVFAKRKLGEVDQVVIKVFSLQDGSSMPQIVRESRALDSARSLGLVLEHQMTPDRFFYVMRYVPGEVLSVITQRLHSLSSIEGLNNDHLGSVMGYGEDLLVALDTYHNAELWHKDVKPDNIIIDGHGAQAKAHLVDFGLVTPMRSSMTLTTHGTEYFRDPELVRQALRGVKVHQIDGSKFDIYGAGAVMFSMIENSFPAHGGLSQLTKRCPEALRWIVRRSMAEYDRRYPSVATMLADLRVVMAAADPYTVKPIDLPSVSQGDVAAADQVDSVPAPEFDMPVNFSRSPIPPHTPHSPRVGAPGHGGQNGARVGRPRTQLTSWWTGKYAVGGVMPRAAVKPRHAQAKAQDPVERYERPLRDVNDRKPAAQQVKDARKRAQTKRHNAGKRIRTARKGKQHYGNTPGIAVVFAGLLGMGVLFIGVILTLAMFTGTFHADEYSSESMVSVMTPDGIEVFINESEVAIAEALGEVFPPDVPMTPVDFEPVDSHDTVQRVDAEILVVPMLSSSLDLHELEEFQSHLRVHGVTLVGDEDPLSGGEERIELVAQLHNAIGAMPIDSKGFQLRVQQWLHTQPFDGVFLIGIEPGNHHRVGVFVEDSFGTSMEYAENTVEELILTLTRIGYGVD